MMDSTEDHPSLLVTKFYLKIGRRVTLTDRLCIGHLLTGDLKVILSNFDFIRLRDRSLNPD